MIAEFLWIPFEVFMIVVIGMAELQPITKAITLFCFGLAISAKWRNAAEVRLRVHMTRFVIEQALKREPAE